MRITGPVVESPDDESDAYFGSRPRPSQVGVWASPQSQPIASRETFLTALARTEERLGGPDGDPVPRPPHWGGYRLYAREVELWVGSDGRAHDRVRWHRELSPAQPGFAGGFRGGAWASARLAP